MEIKQDFTGLCAMNRYMLFNSFSFLIFFPAVTVLYFLIPHAYRWFFLLLAQLYLLYGLHPDLYSGAGLDHRHRLHGGPLDRKVGGKTEKMVS